MYDGPKSIHIIETKSDIMEDYFFPSISTSKGYF